MSDISSDRSSPDALADEQRGWLQVLRNKLGLTGPQTLRDTLEGVLKAPDTNAAFSDAERGMLSRLLRFGASRVDDIMVPRADITALDETEPISELLNTFIEAGVSRIPIFRETLDDPRGMIHIKDLFGWLVAEAKGRDASAGGNAANASVAAAQPGSHVAAPLNLGSVDLSRPIAAAKIRRQVLYVPPSMPAADLLIKMQSSRNHMALVVDEYGGTDGLVTIEDLVEQIVGNIEDEHDEAEECNIVADPKQGLIAAARTPISQLEQHLGVKILEDDDEQDVDTLGGLIFTLLGRVPTRGELIRHVSGLEFEVLDADPRRVKKLKIHVPRGASPRTGGAMPSKAG
ncbi:MAG TPA: hemolysin family protein [Hyphomicrobium sp.]|nr:hemolysin family protein [Hyphomicrobium sp.]